MHDIIPIRQATPGQENSDVAAEGASMLEIVADSLENGRNLGTEENQRTNDNYCHEGNDQRIFD